MLGSLHIKMPHKGWQQPSEAPAFSACSEPRRSTQKSLGTSSGMQPEVVEKTLFTRLKFPKVSAKENLKLRELADLLMEVHYAKEDGYSPGLSYLDTARGIEPIVTKLPYGLQEKWISAGIKKKMEDGFHHLNSLPDSSALRLRMIQVLSF